MSSNNEGVKRPSPDSSKLTGRAKRRALNRAARQMPAPSSLNVLTQDAPNVTGMVRAEDFATARLQEIRTMQSAIVNASKALTALTFQALPREMRRRAASHDLKRLPAHLREKAAKEMEKAPPAKPRKKKGKRPERPDNVAQEYLRRQQNNRWLETHIWHAKRMQMVNLWGYRLAEHPNMKSSRPLYRAFQHLAIVHDASYMGCIELTGSQQDIVKVMNTVTDLHSPSVGSARYIKGQRIGHTHLYEYLGYPIRPICPITFLWKPTADNDKRSMWLWVHPSSFCEAYHFLEQAIGSHSCDVQMQDLRAKLCRFDFSGPRSTAMLQKVLTPVEESNVDNSETRTLKSSRVWRKLEALRSPGALTAGCVIGLTVQDPRLKFPQKVPQRTKQVPREKTVELEKLLAEWPDDISYSDLWDRELCERIRQEMMSEHELAKRRGENLLPGSKLEFTEKDSRVPVLLIQRGFASQLPTTCTASKQTTSSKMELSDGWTLIVPQGWGNAFWKSFVFAETKVAGLNDIHAMYFETGMPCFPYDMVGARAWENMRMMRKNEEENAWLRRPPAKRVNYAKLGLERPFEAAFDLLTNTQPTVITEQPGGAAAEEEEDSDSEEKRTNNKNDKVIWKEKPRPEYYLLHGDGLISKVLSAKSNEEAESLLQSSIAEMFAKRNIEPLYTPKLNVALIQVRVEYLDRGAPEPNALIYLIRNRCDYERYSLPARKKGSRDSVEDEKQMESENENDNLESVTTRFPPSEDHIGYLTTARNSLSAARGLGIGACTALGIRRVYELDQSSQRKVKFLVLVRNINALHCRPAKLQLLA